MIKYIILNVLSILAYSTAFVFRKCSSLLEYLSKKLSENAKDLAEQSETNCHNKQNGDNERTNYLISDTVTEPFDVKNINHNEENKESENNVATDSVSSNIVQNIQIEDYKESNNIATDIITEALNIKNNQNIKKNEVNNFVAIDTKTDELLYVKNNLNEEKKEVGNVAIDTIAESLHVKHINQNEDKKEVNYVAFDTVIEPLHVRHNDQVADEIEVEKVSTDIITELLDTDLNDKEEQVEVLTDPVHISSNYENVNVEIDAVKVEKKPKLRNTAMFLITKTLKENKEKNGKLELESQINWKKRPLKEMDSEVFDHEKDEVPTNKFDQRKWKLSSQNGDEKNDCLDETNDSHSNDTFHVNTSNFKDNSHTNEKSINVLEVDQDVFSLPSEYSIAFCVSEDLNSFSGISINYKAQFGNIGDLMDQNLHPGMVGEIVHNNQHIFYLIVKKYFVQMQYKDNLQRALLNLLSKMSKYNLTKLAIPISGFDRFPISEVKEIISKIFEGSNIDVLIGLKSSKLDVHRPVPPRITSTSKQLWEMECQTDIIMFIDMEKMYLNSWNDEVVENVNARYPFKNRLMNDINTKPMTAGDLLTYTINGEHLFCIFTMPIDHNQNYYKCLEKAYNQMKSQVTGYRYLGIQQEPVNCWNMSRNLTLLGTIFNYNDAEIWLCGDTEFHKAKQFKQYKDFVRDAIGVSKREDSKSNLRTKFKGEKRKSFSSNGITSSYGSKENKYYNNKFNHNL